MYRQTITVKCLYLDTEVTTLTLDRALVSLVIVSDDGVEFYVDLLEGWSERSCSDFTKTVVLPQLDPVSYGMSVEHAALALRKFLECQGAAEICGDALRWDWPLSLELLGASGLPTNIVGCRELVADDIVKLSEGEDTPHHALLDARLICRIASKTKNSFVPD